ncbi:hypothetical protein [Paenibacillus lentus]|uniref:Lipoprotein n=1 Tax=Paenibacillus lentus TaxID=1338368 RepID=A0A3Q8SAJ8_9BACL|nr:hypothetical protein [Paenibacillus lentus]AZK46097.1 hypothetical protein EIM92_07755 [Paenibacillus lentus]
MTNSKVSWGYGFKMTVFLLVVSTSILLCGCTNSPQTGSQEAAHAPKAEAPATNGTNANLAAEQPNPQQNEAITGSETEGLPSGVKVKKVIKDITLKNNYHKKVELLTDGGKRVTITDPNGGLVLLNLEYEGTILEANGRKVTVQVDGGEQQTITIPDKVMIEDDDNLGLNKGVEMEWSVDVDGNIQSVELDD